MALIGVAAAIRWVGFSNETGDWVSFLRPWSIYIAENGYFGALADEFANYNMPYLYLLTALTWLDPHVPGTVLPLIKLSSVFFDAVTAFYAARIVGLRWPDRRVGLIAGVGVLLLPTVVLNGSWWGQCDTVYTAFTVAGVYYLLRERPWLAALLFGIGVSIKLQAFFLFPVLFVLLMAGRIIKLRHLLVIPAVFLGLLVPAWLAGRPFRDLLMIYAEQGGQYDALTLGAPSIYAFVNPQPQFLSLIRTGGLVFTVAAVLVLTYVVLIRRTVLDAKRIVLLAAAFSILAPFLLPGMHERYFMQADVFTLIAAFWVPVRLWFVPLLVQVASISSYIPYLFIARANPPMDKRILALMMFASLLVLVITLLRRDPAEPVVPRQAAPVTRVPEPRPADEPETLSLLVPKPVGNTIAG
ncbi:glycosyltransferase 87 family protein [Actinoplanes sp. DH11]|uniref:glycosyltransferase 87 family protein n=1 Tax=Actinoplanes sp. DH11 TaxID=2857011 RepID=UPI001E361DD2|nr:glycosyltransferase 87 family protein [Actinoplanes sp. DH11]